MTKAKFRSIRLSLGLTGEQWAQALGYGGTPESRRMMISRFENGARAIPRSVAITAQLHAEYYLRGTPSASTTPRDGNPANQDG